MAQWQRSHNCGELRAAHAGEVVTLNGWVENRRDLGGVFFVDLRDRWGRTQILVQPDRLEAQRAGDLMEAMAALKSEDCISVRGRVELREPEHINRQRSTGEIEVHVENIAILAPAQTPPFEVIDAPTTSFETRLRYRYLDLRHPAMVHNLAFRSRFNQAVRECLLARDFLEVETPILTATTPEGARDYLVPSRIHPGSFYALPQSPQIFKQLLMVGGIERYFQIAKCFRDEDLRADRQPEFTQIDLEMSFVEEGDVQEVVESVVGAAFRACLQVELDTPFERLSYAECLRRFGLDKPDLRFGMELCDLSELARGCSFKVFQGAVAAGGMVAGINARGCAGRSRKQIDALQTFTATFGARGLAWLKVGAGGELSGGIAKFFSEQERAELRAALAAEEGDLLLMVADRPAIVQRALGELRVHLGEELGLRTSGEWRFVWVTDFPLFGRDEESGEVYCLQHPFTAPRDWSLAGLEEDPTALASQGYDLVLNGVELGSGSVRIHRRDVQERVFGVLGISPSEAQARFGHLLEAFRYGPPPHGGFAIGVDRLIQLMLGLAGIQDTIAFPKTASAACPLTRAPGPADEQVLRELGLALREEPKPS